MTIHCIYDHQCPECEVHYIPYDKDVPCPKCGMIEEKRYDFISRAAGSALFNLKEYESFVPFMWYTGGLGDHILSLIFGILEAHCRDLSGKSFQVFAREWVDCGDWGDQLYLREHVFGIACRVFDQIETRTTGAFQKRIKMYEFGRFCLEDIEIWPKLCGAKFLHSDFGDGKIIRVEQRPNDVPLIYVRFDDNIEEKVFNSETFIRGVKNIYPPENVKSAFQDWKIQLKNNLKLRECYPFSDWYLLYDREDVSDDEDIPF